MDVVVVVDPCNPLPPPPSPYPSPPPQMRNAEGGRGGDRSCLSIDTGLKTDIYRPLPPPPPLKHFQKYGGKFTGRTAREPKMYEFTVLKKVTSNTAKFARIRVQNWSF